MILEMLWNTNQKYSFFYVVFDIIVASIMCESIWKQDTLHFKKEKLSTNFSRDYNMF